jgi:hypothetical protein
MTLNTRALVEILHDAGEDFEWYPTTRRMVEAVIADLGDRRVGSILDIGAGDGRVLGWLSESEHAEHASLYAIEKSDILRQQQPTQIVPVGTEFAEQDLMGLPTDVIFCNPPYREFSWWAERIISTAHADRMYLVLPQRWKDDAAITAALKARGATAAAIHDDDFLDAERRARAIVQVVRVSFAEWDDYGHGWRGRPDPFAAWFDANIDTFEAEKPLSDYEQEERALARLHTHDSIPALVAAFDEDWARMQANYQAIFRLDQAILKEIGVDKNHVRDALKARMAGLKSLYWHALFDRLDVITSRLTTKTRAHFLERLAGPRAVAFTAGNAYAVTLWAIKAANQYFDQQLVEVFRALSTHDGVSNYASNRKTWEKDGWRYNAEDHSHYALDYRIVLHRYQAIQSGEFGAYDHPGGLHRTAHEDIADLIAVFGNLGFLVQDVSSLSRRWRSNVWQDFRASDGRVIFQVKAFLNGNLHLRFLPEAIKALNIEAGRLLGWLRSPADVVTEMGYTPDEAARWFGSHRLLRASSVPLLGAGDEAA